MPVNGYIVNFPTSTGGEFDGMHFHDGFRYGINEMQKDGGGLKFYKHDTSKQDMQDSESQTLTFKDVRGLLLTTKKKIISKHFGGEGLVQLLFLL